MKHWEDTHPQITAGGLWEQNTHTHVSTRVAHRCLHNIPPSLSQMPFSQKIPHYLYTSKALVHLPRNNYNGYDKLATSVLEHCVRESCSHGKHVCHGQGMIPLVNYGVGNSVFSTRKKKSQNNHLEFLHDLFLGPFEMCTVTHTKKSQLPAGLIRGQATPFPWSLTPLQVPGPSLRGTGRGGQPGHHKTADRYQGGMK